MAIINDHQLQILAKSLGYEFNDLARLRQALTHRSLGIPNNERLEFLGDSILSFIVSEALFEKFPKLREGDLTRLRSQLVKGETLAEIALEFKLDEYVILGQGEKKSGGFRRASILADAFEAIMAAIYFDSNIQTIKQCLLKWFDSRINALDPKAVRKDSKTLLQEWLQAKRKPLPVYKLIATKGDAHDQTFTVQCTVIDLDEPTQGTARSRRIAEQKAAEKALELLDV